MEVVFVSLFLLYLSNTEASEQPQPKIAVIGGGIGGTASAQFLREQFGDDVEIDLYEPGQIGGRLATVEIGGLHYESGGSIIHPENIYMVQFTHQLGLYPRERTGGSLGIYNGDEMIFHGSNYGLLMGLQLMWRYGYDAIRISTYVKDMLKYFVRIYDAQDEGFSFTHPEKLLSMMKPEFASQLKRSTRDELIAYGFGSSFIDELVMGGLRGNYGQTHSIHAFVGSVALAGVQPGLWSVYGGNVRVPQRLMENSGATHVHAKVTKVIYNKSKYTVQAVKESNTTEDKIYDIVIVAVPLHDGVSDIQFEGFTPPVKNFPQKFHRTVATFVQGMLNVSYFGYRNTDEFPTAILTSDSDVFFNSIGKQSPVDYTSGAEDKSRSDIPVYKVFSQEPLTDTQFNLLFQSQKEIQIVDWEAAYPHYESEESNLPGFVLHDNLYYANAIEIAASAMEMGVIGARNTALLAYNHWHSIQDKIDINYGREGGEKEEL